MFHNSGYGSGGHMRNNIGGWERLIIFKIHNKPLNLWVLGMIRSFRGEFWTDNLFGLSFRVMKWSHEEFCSHKMTPRSKVKERETWQVGTGLPQCAPTFPSHRTLNFTTRTLIRSSNGPETPQNSTETPFYKIPECLHERRYFSDKRRTPCWGFFAVRGNAASPLL